MTNKRKRYGKREKDEADKRIGKKIKEKKRKLNLKRNTNKEE